MELVFLFRLRFNYRALVCVSCATRNCAARKKNCQRGVAPLKQLEISHARLYRGSFVELSFLRVGDARARNGADASWNFDSGNAIRVARLRLWWTASDHAFFISRCDDLFGPYLTCRRRSLRRSGLLARNSPLLTSRRATTIFSRMCAPRGPRIRDSLGFSFKNTDRGGRADDVCSPEFPRSFLHQESIPLSREQEMPSELVSRAFLPSFRPLLLSQSHLRPAILREMQNVITDRSGTRRASAYYLPICSL